MTGSPLSVTSQLSRLLATENIQIVQNASQTTASFNLATRVLCLPLWNTTSKELLHMLVVHEVGHALDTPVARWEADANMLAKKHGTSFGTIKSYLNVVEDVRIDKKQKRRFPGSKRDYFLGLIELDRLDFFGIRRTGRNIADMIFIDRANIYYKTPSFAFKIPFSAVERDLLDRMALTETWDDVVELAGEIYAYCRSEMQTANIQSKTSVTLGDEEDGDSGGEIEINEESDDESDEQQPKGDKPNAQENAAQDETSDDDANATKPTSSNDDGDTSTLPTPEPICETDNELARRLSDLANPGNTIPSTPTYIDLPVVDHSQIVEDYKVVLPVFLDHVQNVHVYASQKVDIAKQNFTTWKNDVRDDIAYLVKEFELKKAADNYARTRIAKTGVLDMGKLHTYPYNDDLFRRNAIENSGKNHGFVMLLDWSESMMDDMLSTLKQLFTLTMFCRRVQMPFEVYAFKTDDCHNSGIPGGNFNFGSVKLCNVLSSRMSVSEQNQMYEALFVIGQTKLYPPTYVLRATPLESALLASSKLVQDFRKRTQVQVVNTIILTDGDGDSFYSNVRGTIIVRDSETHCTYEYAFDRKSRLTLMLNILKERTKSPVICFFLTPGLSFRGNFQQDVRDQNLWNKEGYNIGEFDGLDQLFLMKSTKSAASEKLLTVNSTMTKNQIAREFKQFSSRNVTSRTLLRTFIDKIAKRG